MPEIILICRYFGEGTCRFGDACSQAHSDAELAEWKERFEQRKQTIAQQKQAESYPYADKLTEKIMNAENRDTVVAETVEGVTVNANSELSVNITSKRSTHSWLFTVTGKVRVPIQAIHFPALIYVMTCSSHANMDDWSLYTISNQCSSGNCFTYIIAGCAWAGKRQGI